MSQLIELETTEDTITYQLASFGDRLGARIIDALIIFIPNSFVPVIAGWLYWSLQQSGNQQATVGQKAMGIRVISLDGSPVNFGQATGRYFGNFLNIFSFFIGYIMFFFNSKNQCLHDYLSGCLVVKAKEVAKNSDITRHLVD